MNTVILGGGACGLMAAWELARAGHRVTVIERETRPGGLCGTVEDDGFHFDFGGHRVISQNRALVERLERLMGDEFLHRVRSSVLVYRGRRYRYPLDGRELLGSFPLSEALTIWKSYAFEAFRRRLQPRPDETFEDWVVHRFGRELYDRFFGPYTEKLWGLPPTEISSDWAAQRISLLNLSDVLLRLFGLRHGGSRSYARRYLYPKHGIGQLFSRMADEIAAHGGEIRYGSTVTGLVSEPADFGSERRVRAVRVRSMTPDGPDGETEELPAGQVISTLNLSSLVTMLAQSEALPGSSHAALRAASQLRFRAVRFLNIKLDRPEFSPHTWMYVSEPRYLMTRIQEPRHRSPYAAPPGKTSLMLEIPCQVGDRVFCAPTAEIYERCLRDLESLGFRDLARDSLGCFSTFVEEGYPIYQRGYQAERQRALDYVARFTNLTSCGRQGSFRYVFMDTALEMGMLAAERALEGRGATQEIAGLRSERGLIESRSVLG